MKICNDCGRELPDEAFQITRNGVSRFNVCKACRAAKAAKTRQDNAQKWGGGEQHPFSDADFDDKTPGEVIRMMSRAKKWLESRGYSITLRGEYREVKVRPVKFIDK